MLKNTKKNIILRPYKECDLEVMYRIRNSFDLQIMLLSKPRPNTYKKVFDWIEQKSQSNDSVFFVISNIKDITIGFIQATNIDLVSGTCFLGIAIDEKFRREGIAVLAIELLENYLIDVFNIRKTMVHILSENPASLKTFSNSGYELVGVLKQHFYFRKKFLDVTIMEKIHPR